MSIGLRLAACLLAAAPLPILAADAGVTRFGESPLLSAPPDTMPRGAAHDLELVRESVADAAFLAGEVATVSAAPTDPHPASASGDPRVTSDMSSLYWEKDLSGAPILRFDERQVSFDTVVRGELREHTYRFENVSDVPATIAIASACTCTTLEWTEGAIPPGGEGEVRAVFDSAEKSAGELIVIDVILEESAASGNGIIEQVAYDFEIAPAAAADPGAMAAPEPEE